MVADTWVEPCAAKSSMTTMGADASCVVDTNVLIYGTVMGNPWYDQARQWLAAIESSGVRLCVTTQILREYLVVLTRGEVFEKSFTVDQVLTQVDALLPSFAVLDEPIDAANLMRELVHQYQIHGKSIHDANVVAVMLTHGVRRLVTYNSVDFERYEDISLEPIPAANLGS
jgi:predicted nucleic acid-binding protein